MLILEHSCRQCFQGWVGFILCSDQKTVVFVCEECSACFLSPDDQQNARSVPVSRKGLIAGTQIRAFGRGTRWATREEVEAAGWAHLIARDYQPMPPPTPGTGRTGS